MANPAKHREAPWGLHSPSAIREIMNYEAVITALQREKRGLVLGALCERPTSCEDATHCAVGALLSYGGMTDEDIIYVQRTFGGTLYAIHQLLPWQEDENWGSSCGIDADHFEMSRLQDRVLDILDEFEIDSYDISQLMRINDLFDGDPLQRLDYVINGLRELQRISENV